MKNLKIGQRLAFSYAAVLLMMVIVIVITLIRMGDMNDATNRVVNISMKNQRNVAEWTKIVEVNRALLEMAYRMPELDQVKNISDRLVVAAVRSTELQGIIKADLRTAKSQAQLEEVVAARMPYSAARKALLAAKMVGHTEDARRIYETQVLPTSLIYVESISKLAAAQQQSAQNFVADATAAYNTARITLIGLGIIAMVLGVTFGIFITRSIVRPIQDAVAVANRVSSGDLGSEVTVTTRDETGQLMTSLQKMNDNLLGIVTRVRAGTETIATASAEIAAGNQDLSRRTEQQAGSLEETASSMEELTSTVRQNAENARRANSMASEAAGIAGQGGTVIAQVIGTMSEINASSRKIVDIISVIDSIAFQTNILALNAAVEAARAGEQGRGFAVVASEVRNLAHRSAAAAKEIKSLIDDSVQKVEAGSSLVDSAGVTMSNIVQSISLVTGIMSEISHASDEQSAGIEQVNAAVNEMDQATQQNAALVEQAAAAAASMQEQASHLANVVSVFKTSTAAEVGNAAPARSMHAAPVRLAFANN